MGDVPDDAGRPLLFTPIKMRGVTLKNRICVSPMCQYSCRDDSGIPHEWHMVHLGARAIGGAGLVMAEATGVSPEGRISPADTGIWKDEQMESWKPIVAFIKSCGSVPSIQLAHAGRKASTAEPWNRGEAPIPPDAPLGWQPVAPSAIPFTDKHTTPTALDAAGIQKVHDDFVAAARRALAAGFEVIELHYAHGYLMHEFLSPLTNKRTDQYGGSLEHRIRLPLEVAVAVRAVVPPELPLWVRISGTDWAEGGWDVPQSVELCRRLKELGVDLIDCSSGGAVPGVVYPVGPGYQVPIAKAIRAEAGIATGAVGAITEARQAEGILQQGAADVVLLARAFLRDPQWPLHAAADLGYDLAWPNQYVRAKPHSKPAAGPKA